MLDGCDPMSQVTLRSCKMELHICVSVVQRFDSLYCNAHFSLTVSYPLLRGLRD